MSAKSEPVQAIVLQMKRTLRCAPELPDVAGVRLRTYSGPDDIEIWIDVRRRAFARERVGVREWCAADFEREFLSKPWWQADRLWFAETVPNDAASEPEVVGTVTLAQRGEAEKALPVVHWLAVMPRWRRRGVAQLLMAQLEACCWNNDWRDVYLETHRSWTRAVQFYRSLDYHAEGSE